MKGLKSKENVRSDPQLFIVFMRLTRFWPMFLFYTPWKPLVFCLFRMYKMEILATNGLIYFFSLSLIPSCINADWYLLPSSSVFRKIFVVRKDKVFFTAYFLMPQKIFSKPPIYACPQPLCRLDAFTIYLRLLNVM